MITDLSKCTDFIVQWIKNQAAGSKATSLILGVSGGVDSAVVAGLCARTGLPVCGVLMPCHSSPSSVDRGNEVIKAFDIKSHTVNLEPAFMAILGQVAKNTVLGVHATGALRSCLRAPTLDFVSKVYGGIIVGTGNRDEDEVTRYFQKRGDGCVDISPIAQLHKSEVYQLAEYLGVPQSIIDATPSADLWGPDAGQTDEGQLGMSYKEVEWGIRAGGKYSLNQPVRHHHFHEYLAETAVVSEREQYVLKTLADMELASRHKENPNLPVCQLRREGFTD